MNFTRTFHDKNLRALQPLTRHIFVFLPTDPLNVDDSSQTREAQRRVHKLSVVSQPRILQLKRKLLLSLCCEI